MTGLLIITSICLLLSILFDYRKTVKGIKKDLTMLKRKEAEKLADSGPFYLIK